MAALEFVRYAPGKVDKSAFVEIDITPADPNDIQFWDIEMAPANRRANPAVRMAAGNGATCLPCPHRKPYREGAATSGR